MSDKNIENQDFENESFDEQGFESDSEYSDNGSEDWSHDDLDDSELNEVQSDKPAQKKKNSNLMIAIITVVIVVAVLGVMGLSGGADNQNVQMSEAQQVINVDPDVTPEISQDDLAGEKANNIGDLKAQQELQNPGDQIMSQVAQNNDAGVISAQPQQGLMDNPAILDNDNQATNVAPEMPQQITSEIPQDLSSPTPVDMMQENISVEGPALENTNVAEIIPPNVKPVSDFPTVDSIKKPEISSVDAKPDSSLQENTLIEQSSPVISSVAQEDDAVIKMQSLLGAAQEKIASLEREILERDSALAAAKANLEAAPLPLISEKDIEALKSRISDLEGQLAQANKEKEDFIINDSEVENDKPAVSAIKSELMAKKPLKTSDAKKVSKVAKSIWSLKSAGSGKAILADKRTGDLKTVVVGEVVSGLGRILSISNTSAGWVVKGSSGVVSE